MLDPRIIAHEKAQPRGEPIGVGCTLARLGDGRYFVQPKQGYEAQGMAADDRYFGKADFKVAKQNRRDVVIARRQEEDEEDAAAGSAVDPGFPFDGLFIEFVYNLTTVTTPVNLFPPAVGMFAEIYVPASDTDPGTGFPYPDPSPGDDCFLEDSRGLTEPVPDAQRPYWRIDSFTGPRSIFVSGSGYDYEFVVYDIQGLRYDP